MLFKALFIVWLVVVAIQFVYYVLIFGKFSFQKNKQHKKIMPPISVVVCAKNEAENIKKYLPLLLQQNYPTYEVVLIDDASTDETAAIFESFRKQDNRIKIVKVVNNEAFWGNKKYALTLGIKATTYNHLLFIDADCYPNSTNWISEMASCFSKNKAIILGYGGYKKIKSSFLNKIIRYETMLTAIQYFGWALIGKPYMGVGRNLAYTKELFFKERGFQNHLQIRSGDDDLFVNGAATTQNTNICYTKESCTYSEPKKTVSEWFLQKRRHTSTAKYYKVFDKLQLGLFYITQLLFILIAFVLLFSGYEIKITALVILFRYLFTWVIVGFSAKKVNEIDLIYWFPIIEFVLVFTQLGLFFTNLLSKDTIRWK